MIYDAAMTSPAASPVRDFTRSVEPITFTCDGETYRAPRTINPLNLKAIVASISGINLEDQRYLAENFDQVAPIMAEVLKALVPGKGGQRLADRMLAPVHSEDEYAEDPDLLRPLDLITQAIPIMTYVLEELGFRPTTPSSDSSDGSMAAVTDIPNDGTSSMAGASPTESEPTS